jgi:hypothetical protein
MFKVFKDVLDYFVDLISTMAEDHAISNYEFDETTEINVDTTPPKTLLEWFADLED